MDKELEKFEEIFRKVGGLDLEALDKQIAKERERELTTEELMQQAKDASDFAKLIGAKTVVVDDIKKKKK